MVAPIEITYRAHPTHTSKHHISNKIWCRILGTLWSLSIAIPCGIGLFCHLPAALCCTICVPLTPAIHTELTNWRRLMLSLKVRPTHMLEVDPHPTPDLIH